MTHFVVVVKGEKRPYAPGGRCRYVGLEEVDVWIARGYNVGSTGVHALKLDFDDPAKARDLIEAVGPIALNVATPSGGFHSYFAPETDFGPAHIYDTSGETIGEVKRRPREYCVMPPSTFKGRPYVWLEPLPDVLEPLPDAWRKYLTVTHGAFGPKPAAPGEPFAIPDRVSKGGRRDFLFRLTRSFKARGLELGDALEAARLANEGILDPPLAPQEEDVPAFVARAWWQRDRKDWER